MYASMMSDVPALRGRAWEDEAACKNIDPRFFTLSGSLKDVNNNEDNFIIGEVVCSKCPVIEKCYKTATEDDLAVTMRGGAWPTDFFEKPKGGRPKAATCKYGHDTSHPDQRTSHGQCRACKKAGRNRRYAESKAGV